MMSKPGIKSFVKDILGVQGSEVTEREIEETFDVVEEEEMLKTEFIADDGGELNIDVNKEEIVEPGLSENKNQTIFINPKSYSESKKIANYIKLDKTVMVNLENLDSGIAQRILDFVLGAAAIKRGKVVPVGKRIYSIVPNRIEVVLDGKVNNSEQKNLEIIE